MKSLVCITGATGGLGRAFAAECAARGWDLFLTDLGEEQLSALTRGLSSTYGIKVLYGVCDLTSAQSRLKLFRRIKEENLRFWSLINIAGVDFEGYFSKKTREQIRMILRVNIEANLEMTHAILEARDENRVFRLINTASLASFYPMPVKATYAASKRFLLNFSLALREELRSIGGTVTVLCPAGLPTTEEVLRRIAAQGLMGRITTKNVGYVAAKTIDHALKGHSVYIPGAINRFLKFLGSIVPPTFVSRLIGMRWGALSPEGKGRTARSLC
ncbi:MAG TPA: SDR family NAD(P)-dependent oxidoreductase [Firmicutes bacterium]|jgi:short-subunit dehydrogenase|nr:SDR family NAD(P)-dependent oxidoreductase [Bacillota bacterium]